MNITLSPVCAPIGSAFSDPLCVSMAGTSVYINGFVYDFKNLNSGDTLISGATDCPYIVGPILRTENGTLELTLIFPHGYDAPHEARFPEPIHVTEDGPVTLPDACWPPAPAPEPEYPEEPQPEPEDDSEER